MTFEFSTNDNIANDLSNPFKVENVFLLLSALALAGGAVSILLTARTHFHNHEDRIASVALLLAAIFSGVVVKFLILALSQIRFYLGRKFPIGLADEVPSHSYGLAAGALPIIDALRHGTVDFAEPQGPLNGVLYSLIKPLITSPPPIQSAAVQHFHALIKMTCVLCSMATSYFFSAGTESEGVISWIYLPMTGLSLLTPLMELRAANTNSDEVPNANSMLWKLNSLVSFAVLTPVLIPRYLPVMHVPPMWIAPALLQITSIVSYVIFLLSLLSQLDDVRQTSVSLEHASVSMNCHPAQLWIKVARDLQEIWERNVPNRVYANVAPGMADGDSSRGAFQGYLLEETQPISASIDQSTRGHIRWLITLNLWGLFLSIIATIVGAYFASRFVAMERMEISRVILVVTALLISATLAFNTGHLLWSRMHFKSRLVLISIEGTFQNGEMRIGNQLSGQVQSRATITRIQDATLRMWVADITTVVFGKANKRFITGMAPADSYAKATIDGLRAFALSQSSIAAPTSIADIEIAKSIGYINSALAPSFQDSAVSHSSARSVAKQ